MLQTLRGIVEGTQTSLPHVRAHAEKEAGCWLCIWPCVGGRHWDASSAERRRVLAQKRGREMRSVDATQVVPFGANRCIAAIC